MKTNVRIQYRFIRVLFVLPAILTSGFLTSCDDDAPTREDTPELITKVTLTFSPVGGGDAITASATDPDGEGVQDISIDGPIKLAANTSYDLSIELLNELADPADAEYNITEEVEEEGDEHMFFFSWTNDVFSNPSGDGNIDSREDAVIYADEDDKGQPIGLQTSWTTAGPSSGTFRVVLKHQPELKTATSSASAGETDLDLEFEIEVQ